MARASRDIPPPLELQCLTALWHLGEANVQAVRDFLAPRKKLAYTTVMTMLDRLTRKKVLSRRKAGRSFLYLPLVSRDEIRRLAIGEMVDQLFDGDAGALLAFLNGAARPMQAGAQEEEETRPLDAALL